MDILGEILSSLSFKELNITEFLLRAPWSISTEGFIPGFNLIVVEGHFWAKFSNGETVRLGAGESLVMPRGGLLEYCSALNVPPTQLNHLWDEEQYRELSETPAAFYKIRWGGGGDETVLLGFAFQLSETSEEQLLPNLPDMMVLGRDEATFSLVLALLNYLGMSDKLSQGEFATRARLAESVVVDQIRRHVLETDSVSGWMAGIRQKKLQNALAHIHKRYDQPWSVASLAAECGMSRAAFAKLFSDVLGQPPLEYLNDRRVRQAKRLLQSSSLSVSEISFRVGFSSEIALRRNMRRLFGVTPRSLRHNETQR